jgi:hypothetical protein
MPLKYLYYCQKMIQRYFTIKKFCLFSLGGGNLQILTEVAETYYVLIKLQHLSSLSPMPHLPLPSRPTPYSNYAGPLPIFQFFTVGGNVNPRPPIRTEDLYSTFLAFIDLSTDPGLKLHWIIFPRSN